MAAPTMAMAASTVTPEGATMPEDLAMHAAEECPRAKEVKGMPQKIRPMAGHFLLSSQALKLRIEREEKKWGESPYVKD